MPNDQTNKFYSISAFDIARAIEILKQGGIVAFPTETYYGLAVDPFNPDAIARLYKVKKRRMSKPILTLIHDKNQLTTLIAGDIPAIYGPLMDHFWPGPLTLIFKAHERLPVSLTGGTGTVGVRIPSHPAALLLTQAFLHPITATSANISGLAAAENAQEVHRQFGTDIDMLLDGGETVGGAGSTLVGLKGGKLKLVRSGVIPFEEIAEKILQ